MKYRKKTVVIEAVQWQGDNLEEIALLGGGREYEQDFPEAVTHYCGDGCPGHAEHSYILDPQEDTLHCIICGLKVEAGKGIIILKS